MHWSITSHVATIPVGRPGWPWTWTLLQELVPLVRRFSANPTIDLLVLDFTPSPGWDLTTLQEVEDRQRCAVVGQQFLQEFRALPIPTLAVLNQGAVGPAWELALACDYRIATATPSAWVGWPEAPPAWGSQYQAGKWGWGRGRVELRQLLQQQRLTVREAQTAGLIDDAFTVRRAAVEREHWMRKLQHSGRKRVAAVPAEILAADRVHFRSWVPPTSTVPPLGLRHNSIHSVTIFGRSSVAAHWQTEAALHGLLVHSDSALSLDVEEHLTRAVRRGRVTPLESEQARQRFRRLERPDAVWIVDDRFADWSWLQRSLGPRTLLFLPPAILDDVSRVDSRHDRQLGLVLDSSNFTAELVPWSTTSLGVVQAGRAFVEHLGYCVRQFSPVTHLEQSAHDGLSWTERFPAYASG